MATTSIWKFNSRLKTLINYVSNTNKTDNGKFVFGINCIPTVAYQEMINTKMQFLKTDGIKCFHAYQSFAEGEVSPETAHEIGIKLAKQIWGDKFQVIVATHINTDNIHNHFVLNSISFVDGKRFCNTKRDYALMRTTSDNLCREYGLSILKEEKIYNKYVAGALYKTLMKDSIDYAISQAKNYNDFLRIITELDYIVTDNGNSLSIRKEPYKRNSRIERQFGKQYSKENIFKRIIETQSNYLSNSNDYVTSIKNFQKNYNEAHTMSLLELILRLFLFTNDKLLTYSNKPPEKVKLSPELINDIKKLNEYSKQCNLISQHKLKNTDDIKNLKSKLNNDIAPLLSKRESLWKKHKRAKTESDKLQIEKEIANISKIIFPLTEDIKICNNILDRIEEYKKLELHNQILEERKKTEIELKSQNKSYIK